MSAHCVIEGERALVTLDGPHHNAIDRRTWDALTALFLEFAANASLRCVVVTGANGHFAAGADIGEFSQLRADLLGVRHYHERIIAPALLAIINCPCPVLAAIEGDCIGGGLEIAASCDLRYASETARFGVPIGRLGFSMAPDEMTALLRLAGPAVTAELLYEGRLLDANEAAARGLLTGVVKPELLSQAVAQASSRVCAQAPIAQRINKRLIAALVQGELDASQRAYAFSYAETHDHGEGVSAFVEGRAPRFTNN